MVSVWSYFSSFPEICLKIVLFVFEYDKFRYVSTYNDVLMANPPFWLKSFLYAEAVVQFPFFFVAVYALLKKRNWIRIPGIFYGVHVSTTVVPLLCEIIGSSLLSKNEKLTLVSFYFPYFLIPLWFALELAKRNQVWPSKEIKNA